MAKVRKEAEANKVAQLEAKMAELIQASDHQRALISDLQRELQSSHDDAKDLRDLLKVKIEILRNELTRESKSQDNVVLSKIFTGHHHSIV